MSSISNILEEVYGRVLSQVDRDPNSVTYGSCDRNYWMYKLHDFSSGILQQTSLFFAELTLIEDPEARLSFANSSSKTYWTQIGKAINRFTLQKMSKNGTVDEYFPGESSYVASSFVGYSLIKSSLILNDWDVLNSPKLRKLFDSFCSKQESPAANQDMGCAAFIHLYAKIHNYKRDTANATCNKLVSRNTSSGQFREYGGFDYGYSTVSLNFLAYLHEDGYEAAKPKLENLFETIQKLTDFESKEFGGEIGSRSTSYLLPFGIATASRLMKKPVESKWIVWLQSTIRKLDDRYLIHYTAPSLASFERLLSQEKLKIGSTLSTSLHPTSGTTTFDDIYRVFGANFSFTINIKKGGVYHFRGDNKEFADNGYVLKESPGSNQKYYTNLVTEFSNHKIEEANGVIRIKCENTFSKFKTLTPSPLKFVVLRALTPLGPLLNILFKRILIKRPKVLRDTVFKREVLIIPGNSITITDSFFNLKDHFIVKKSSVYTTRTVPSSKFYHKLDSNLIDCNPINTMEPQITTTSIKS